ncbi:MAG: XylR family transcriptional regulator [Planctomycetota bacterium]
MKPKPVAVLMNLSRPYDRQVIRGISRYAPVGVPWQLYVEEDPGNRIPSFTRWSARGAIVDLDDTRLLRAVRQLAAPTVGIGHLSPVMKRELGISTVRSDNEAIGVQAADHLMELGLAYFAYYSIPRRGGDIWPWSRYQSFRHRLQTCGFRCVRFSGKHYAARNWSHLLEELVRWLRSLPRPTGILAGNDSCARHLLEACRESGLRVPDDVAVLGVDNDELTCELALPPLSSIAQGAEQIGYQAAALLDKLMIRRRQRTVHLVVPPLGLVKRQSTDLVAPEHDLVGQALSFIRARAPERIGANDVARHLDVSRSTLDGRFKSRLGRTVHEELERVRLQTVRRLLLTTDLPLNEVARQSGYSSIHYLCHVFRRALQQTPSQFRAGRGALDPAPLSARTVCSRPVVNAY